MRGPIVEQRAEILRVSVAGPVELRRKVVEPAAREPELNVGVEFIVLTETLDAGRATVRTAEAEGTDTKFHPRFFRVHDTIDLLHEAADVLAAPVGAGKFSAGSAVILPRRFVGKIQIGAIGRLDGVRIKIIVDVNAVDVVATHNITHDSEGARDSEGFDR